MIIPIISATIVILSIIYLSIEYYNRKLDKENHRLLMQIERNNQVYHFRLRLLNQFGHTITDAMPDYDSMLNSDRELVAKEWVMVDELVNLN